MTFVADNSIVDSNAVDIVVHNTVDTVAHSIVAVGQHNTVAEHTAVAEDKHCGFEYTFPHNHHLPSTVEEPDVVVAVQH